MFDEEAHPRRSVAQLRGDEGVRVKRIFKDLADRYGIEWARRQGGGQDPINKALDVGNSCLYGLCEAVILTLGYSPALGFVHSGDPRSFVFDIADTVKFQTVVPLAFELASESGEKIDGRVRRACRDAFFKRNMAQRLIENIERIFDATCAN